jgi:pyruvyltransferase
MSDIGMWWWRPKGGGSNFGDELGPAIVQRLGHTVRRVRFAEAELVACGSILNYLPNPSTAIWGSGLMHPDPVQPFHSVHALRGHLTAARLGHDVPLGDPGLLVGALWDRPKVRHRLGVVRHFVDATHYPWAEVTIDATSPVEEVIAGIGACATIASSSLHGLLVAISFGIPAMRIPHSEVKGGNFKWLDALSALDLRLPEVQRRLLAAFPW